jgi:exonuclease VII large subunit
MAEFEIAGTTFRGGKMFVVLTALSTLGGAAWGGFEVYKDYMDMKEIIQNIDTDAIEARNAVIETKLDEAIEYTRDIKSGLRDDILAIEKTVDRMEDKLREQEQETRDIIQNAEERFENKRDALQNDYDEKANRLAERNDNLRTDLENKVDRDLNDLEQRLNKKLQRALDNPLAN